MTEEIGVIRSVDKDRKSSGFASAPQPSRIGQRPQEKMSDARGSEIDEIYRRLEPELRRTKPNPEAIAAALEAAQRLADQTDSEQSAEDVTSKFMGDLSAVICPSCGHGNRSGHKFCAMCGIPVETQPQAAATFETGPRRPFPDAFLEAGAGMTPPANRTGLETHHYHHHYHYFPAGYEGGSMRSGSGDAAREEKVRPNAALRGDMNRAEAGVRRVTQEWAVACNTKHLDDLLELYVADALVLRSNYPPVRGAAAVREFFFGAMEAGLGEVELEPLRVEVVGDLAYEAGRCKALVPGAAGKRREERGKYLWVCARQSNGEWKLTADCWSSDLSLSIMESDVPAGMAVKTNPQRKG